MSRDLNVRTVRASCELALVLYDLTGTRIVQENDDIIALLEKWGDVAVCICGETGNFRQAWARCHPGSAASLFVFLARHGALTYRESPVVTVGDLRAPAFERLLESGLCMDAAHFGVALEMLFLAGLAWDDRISRRIMVDRRHHFYFYREQHKVVREALAMAARLAAGETIRFTGSEAQCLPIVSELAVKGRPNGPSGPELLYPTFGYVWQLPDEGMEPILRAVCAMHNGQEDLAVQIAFGEEGL